MKKPAKKPVRTRAKKPATIIADLRERLENAEQTLDAIRSGSVDALIVSGPTGERVFTLQGADHRYRRIVESMTEGAAIVGTDGIILYANSSFSKLVGTPLDRVLGSQLRKYVPKASLEIFERLIHDAQSKTTGVDAPLSSGGGRTVPVHISATADGEIAGGGVCLIFTDLSESLRDAEARKQELATQLAEQTRLVDGAISSMPSALITMDRDGVITVANARAEALLGRPLVATSTDPTRVTHPSSNVSDRSPWGGYKFLVEGRPVPPNQFPIARSLRTGADLRNVELDVHRPDGVVMCLSISASPLRDDAGKIVGAVAVFDDVSEMKRLHAQLSDALEQREKLLWAEKQARTEAESASRLKDEFLATLSHELRTPLNSILGWGRMLIAGTVPAEKRVHALATIVRNASAQHQLIEDLLDISRIITGNLRLSVEPMNLSAVIEAAIEAVQPAADAKEVSLHVDIDPDLGAIRGDASRLQQVVWNLITNAVKFTQRGGSVILRLEVSAETMRLSVVDTGAGIDPSFLPFVFDRFRQEDGGITRRTGGLGLGLSIAKQIVELHGGTLSAKSEGVRKGSTFVVELPFASPKSVPPVERRSVNTPRAFASPIARSQLAGISVLVVDDETDARELLQSSFEQHGAVVSTASNVSDALEILEKTSPNVIVSDIGMPGEDGYSFIRKVRALTPEKGGLTPALALTAYARAEDRARALREGFQTHAAKPVEPLELLTLVAKLARPTV